MGRVRSMKELKKSELTHKFFDEELRSHGKGVKIYSKLLSEKMGFSENKIKEISEAAYLHDIGKALIDQKILKKGKLNPEEFKEIKKHPIKGLQPLEELEVNTTTKNVVLYHHERWDGSGYPHGLKDTEIPIEARIVSLADVYDALREKRSYKDPMSHEKACEIIYSLSEKNFDPNIVKVFKKYSDSFENIKENS